MSLSPLPKSKVIFIYNLSLRCLCAGILMLFGWSCSKTDKELIAADSYEKLRSAIDSIVGHIHSVDSLMSLTETYVSENNDYGEMKSRKALGELYQSSSDYITAIEELNRSLILAEKLEDTLCIIENLNLLGDSHNYLGVTGQSAECFFRALVVCDQWSKKNSDEALCNKSKSQFGIGRNQYTLGNYVRAEDALRLAMESELRRNNLSRQAEIYAGMGKIKEKTGQLDSAFLYYERSLELNRNVKSKEGIAVCYNHFGRLAESNKDWDAALRYYYRAYYLMSEEQVRESTIESSLSMAQVYMKRGDTKNARHFIDKGWNLAVNTRSWKMMSRACLLQSKYDEMIGDTKDALNWYKMSVAYNDSVTNERTKMFVQKIRQQYVSEKYNNELEILRKNYTQAQNDSRAFVAWAILAGLFALLCIAFLLYTLRVRLRSQQMMRHMEKVRTDFFTNITHEFRTPLTVMLGLGRQIESQKGVTDEVSARKIGEMIVRQGNSLLDLVNQLLDIAKAESAVDDREWRCGDIAPYISMIIENCQVFAEQKNVLLVFASSERELEMDFVPEYIKKVLQNLLTNAIKYSGDGGKVTVQMGKKGHYMNLVVSDTGNGVPEEDLSHIFDAFYTATNWGIEVSTGVGLAMVKQMIISMGGKINVESTLGQGTTFYIELPLRQDGKSFTALESDVLTGDKTEEYLPSQFVDKADVPVDDLADATRPTVLVIEDNRDVATFIGMQLSGRYRVGYALNGKEGVEKAEELMPDLIVTDLMMPLMNGYEVCRSIRSSEALANTPIIIVSAKSTESDKLKGLEAGADAYLYKPFNSDEFRLTVANLIEQRKLQRTNYASVSTVALEEEESVLKPLEREFLNKFVDVVYRQMPKGLVDAESLASIMCMSSSQLRRRIFAITGQKLTTYVLQIRLKQAKQLLETQGDMPVADVASKCGFEDAAYFSRIFKNFYQMTPSQYRKQSL